MKSIRDDSATVRFVRLWLNGHVVSPLAFQKRKSSIVAAFLHAYQQFRRLVMMRVHLHVHSALITDKHPSALAPEILKKGLHSLKQLDNHGISHAKSLDHAHDNGEIHLVCS